MRNALEEKIAVIDTETTGISCLEDRVVQISVLRAEGGVEESCQTWLVHPGIPIPTGASDIHGITDADVADSRSWRDVWPEVREAIGGRSLLSYNGVSFDVPLIHAECARHGLGCDLLARLHLDALVWIRSIDRYVRGSGRHRLTTTCQRHGISIDGAHSSDGDVRMTLALARRVLFPLNIATAGMSAMVAEQEVLRKKQEIDFINFLKRQKR